MTGERLRLGVVGVGHLGRHHARLVALSEGATLAAVADLDRARADAAASGTSAFVSTDYRQILDRVDAVTIAVPTVDHLAVARDFLQAGIPVLVEKPMAVSVAEADEMLALAARSGTLVAVGHTERFNPAIEAALDVIGHPRFIEIHRLSGFPERSLDIDVVFDVMIHDLDLVLAIDRSPIAAVEAIGVPVLTHRADIANARIRFSSGCIANITASRISRDKVRKFRCFQQDMYVSVDAGERSLEVWRLRRRDGQRPAIEGGPMPVPDGEPLGRELADFIHAVRTKTSPRVSGADGRQALELATRVAAAIEDSLR